MRDVREAKMDAIARASVMSGLVSTEQWERARNFEIVFGCKCKLSL